MKKPALPAASPTWTDAPDTGTVFTSVNIGNTRMGTLVSVRKEGDEWFVYVGAERICVGADHAYALIVAEAWCRGRAIRITAVPVDGAKS